MWQMKTDFTETEWLAASEEGPSKALLADLDGSTCKLGAGRTLSLGKVMGEVGRSKFVFLMVCFLTTLSPR